MGKRAFAAVMWFIATWVVGAMVAYANNLPLGVVAIAAIAAGVLIAADPLGVLWARKPLDSHTPQEQ